MTVTASTTVRIDPAAVLAAVRAAKAHALPAAAELVRDEARRSIRRGRTAPPGQPPATRSGFLPRTIVATYDPATETALVGPVLTPARFRGGDGKPTRSTVPGVLERGGTIANRQALIGGRWRNDSQRLQNVAPTAPRRTATAIVEARPFMAPALAATAPKFPALFLNSLGGP